MRVSDLAKLHPSRTNAFTLESVGPLVGASAWSVRGRRICAKRTSSPAKKPRADPIAQGRPEAPSARSLRDVHPSNLMPNAYFVGLPGFHGSSKLFEPMVAACPPDWELSPIELPCDIVSGYDELEEWLVSRLPTERCWLIAESFSGPLALRLAARGLVAGLVLSATFVRSPVPEALRRMPVDALVRVTPPRAAIRLALTGGDDALAQAVIREVERLPKPVLAARLRALQTVDVTHLLPAIRVPILYLQATRDRVVPSRCADELTALRPDARVVRIDAPHLVLQTSPVEAWSAIERFVSEHG